MNARPMFNSAVDYHNKWTLEYFILLNGGALRLFLSSKSDVSRSVYGLCPRSRCGG